MDEWFCDEESTLGYDEACINLRTNDKDSNAWLYLLSADCALVSHARTRSFLCISCFAYLRVTFYESDSEFLSEKIVRRKTYEYIFI